MYCYEWGVSTGKFAENHGNRVRLIPLLIHDENGGRTPRPDIRIRVRSPARTVERWRKTENDHVDSRPPEHDQKLTSHPRVHKAT